MRRCMEETFYGVILIAAVGSLLVFLPILFRIRPRIVLSGSMEPEIPVGSLVYITNTVLPENIKTGDVIAYQLNKSLSVLHRVIQVEDEKQRYHTKGDANQQEDLGTVGFSQYEGKAVLCIPYLGYVIKFFQTGHRVFWILCGLAGMAAVDILSEKREGEKKKCREKNGNI